MASVDCGMDSWEADLFPASLASMYLSACSSVMAWLGSPRTRYKKYINLCINLPVLKTQRNN